jgi:hypothetical protein
VVALAPTLTIPSVTGGGQEQSIPGTNNEKSSLEGIMTETEFNALAAQGYNRIPVTLETFADLDTPLSIYLKLADTPYSYLLESVQGGERFGRYSFIGISAAQTRIAVYGHQVLVLTGQRISEREDDTNPLDFIEKFMTRFRARPRPTCRVSAAVWSVPSATTRCAMSRPS